MANGGGEVEGTGSRLGLGRVNPAPGPPALARILGCQEGARGLAAPLSTEHAALVKRIVALEILQNHRVRLRFADGAAGEVDFSRHAGKGVFAPLADEAFFRRAALGDQGRTLTWPGELDFCADALWLQVTGKTAQELFPDRREGRGAYAHA